MNGKGIECSTRYVQLIWNESIESRGIERIGPKSESVCIENDKKASRKVRGMWNIGIWWRIKEKEFDVSELVVWKCMLKKLERRSTKSRSAKWYFSGMRNRASLFKEYVWMMCGMIAKKKEKGKDENWLKMRVKMKFWKIVFY